jgi:haloalkane dehalogenase
MAISDQFPYESQYVEVLGSKMHYVEKGEGEPILFLHGNPTSSYLWRNIIPYAAEHGRAIAVDLIGMGRSDKPDIDYRFVDHAAYVDGFIEEMGLENITLVIHDWGSGLGFHYAHRHPDNIRGIAFMEALLRPTKWSDTNLVERFLFKRMRDPVKGDRMNIDKNFFVKRLLPMMTSRKLTETERDAYGEPFIDPPSRKPVAVWPREIPFEGEGPEDVYRIVSDYWAWLQETDIPKLMLVAKPGVIIKGDVADELEAALPTVERVNIGKGKHYVQEDQPEAIGQALDDWLGRLP